MSVSSARAPCGSGTARAPRFVSSPICHSPTENIITPLFLASSGCCCIASMCNFKRHVCTGTAAAFLNRDVGTSLFSLVRVTGGVGVTSLSSGESALRTQRLLEPRHHGETRLVAPRQTRHLHVDRQPLRAAHRTLRHAVPRVPDLVRRLRTSEIGVVCPRTRMAEMTKIRNRRTASLNGTSRS